MSKISSQSFSLFVASTLLLAPGASHALDGPMLGDPEGFWADLGLQYRLRLEIRANSELEDDIEDVLLFGVQRARLQLDAHYQDWVQAFVQLQDSRTLGYGNSSMMYDGNTDLHQAWAKLSPGKVFSLKAGRQRIDLGDQRLVGSAEWSNIGRIFDGIRVTFTHPLGKLDLFGTVFTPGRRGSLLKATWFFGGYSALSFIGGAIVWDVYALGLIDAPGSLFPGDVYGPAGSSGAGPERQLVTLGSRLRFCGRGLSASLEGAWQGGYHHAGYDTGSESIDHNAWALHADLGYIFDVPTRPFIHVEVNHASGNDVDPSLHWHRFDNLFPTNHGKYGLMDLMGWSSALNGSLTVGLHPHDKLMLRADYWILARGSRHDGWYSSSGRELAPPPDGAAPSVHDTELMLGHEVNLVLDVSFGPHARLQNGMGVFVPRGFGRVVGSTPQLWAYTMLLVQF